MGIHFIFRQEPVFSLFYAYGPRDEWAVLPGFQAEADGTRYLTDSSFDAAARLKQVHPINPRPYSAKRAEKQSKSNDATKDKEKDKKIEKKSEEESKDSKKKSFFKKDFHKTNGGFSARHRSHRLFVPIRGALSQVLPNWEKIQGLEIVRDGLQANWNQLGPSTVQKPRELVLLRSEEERQAFQEILLHDLQQNIVQKTNSAILHSPVFLAKKTSGKYRRIILCKTVNQHLNVEHFHMERLIDARKIIINQGWAITWDLQQAYSHLSVSTVLRQYLAFRFKGQTFQYITVPFGISTTPRLFTKVMRVVLAHLRTKVIFTTAYIDDDMAWFQTRAQAEEGMMQIKISRNLMGCKENASLMSRQTAEDNTGFCRKLSTSKQVVDDGQIAGVSYLYSPSHPFRQHLGTHINQDNECNQGQYIILEGMGGESNFIRNESNKITASMVEAKNINSIDLQPQDNESNNNNHNR
ncbi:MAG: hypothetical protein EZS28_027735 [Streblomastix strix]|uniref:Reverse transcriptase domain-containing protein n=1 Tax=Streblomastix strix TaxID=222440 RepID=A0A5J4V207_9EUKA|nr:MAG: hypothetical protein EZS28_027735 [Streblomastix strix]